MTPEAIIIAAIVIDVIVVDVTVNQASAAAVLPVSLFSLQLRIKELVVQYMQATYFGVYRVPQPTEHYFWQAVDENDYDKHHFVLL